MQRQIHEYHPLIGYRFIPGISARVPHEGGGYLVKTNEAGFRCDHEFTQEKPPGKFRVLLFGDSFTAGDGVSNQYRYGDVLESHFSELEVLNFGLSGSGTDQQYLIFQEFAKSLEYDVLMICPLVENIRRIISRYRPATLRASGEEGVLAKPYFEFADDKLVLQHVPVPKQIFRENELSAEEQKFIDNGGAHVALRKVVNSALKPLKPFIQAMTSYQPVPQYDRPSDPAWLLMKAILTRWIGESDGHPVLICPIPLYQHVEQTASAEHYQQRFQELADLEQVTVIDPLPRFWEETPADRRRCRFNSDPHLTVYGHQVLAAALQPALAEFLRSKAS